MYNIKSNLIIGFHGCDVRIRNKLLTNPNEIRISTKPYDWLGHGLYFWENNFERAMQWAEDKQKRGQLEHPAVLGAVLSLGYCCDFLETRFIDMLDVYYKLMVRACVNDGKPIPTNKDLKHDSYRDKILRERDCAVIEYMHEEMSLQIHLDTQEKGISSAHPFDSIRGAFTEGGPAFEGAGLHAKTHIQLCIRNMNCIRGFFLPRKETAFAPIFPFS
jgi:hypothetical protein